MSSLPSRTNFWNLVPLEIRKAILQFAACPNDLCALDATCREIQALTDPICCQLAMELHTAFV